MSGAIAVAETPIIEQRPFTGRFRPPAAMAAPMGFLKNTTQSACAGLLTLAGATQLTTGAAVDGLSGLSGWSLETVGAQLVAGNTTGLLQILGAVALFLSAGRGLARVLGVLIFVAAATAYFNGVDVIDILDRSRDVYRALGPAYKTFQTALMSS